jgi:hypothetical protein
MTRRDKPEVPRQERKPRQKTREKTLTDRLLAIAKDCARRLTSETRTIDHARCSMTSTDCSTTE